MTTRVAEIIAKRASAIGRLRHYAGRLRRGRAGMAAVEFALILPLMLTLYFGCAVLAQGLEVARKTQLLSHTLADLTSRQLAGDEPLGNCASYSSVPCLLDSDIQNILNASTAVLYPFTGSPNMTITEIIFDNVSTSNTNCCVARVMWSVGTGPNSTLRSCGTQTQSSNGVNGSNNIPAGVYPASVTNNVGPDNHLIVADVSYTYTPSFGFALFAWNQSPNGNAGYTISQTTYMTPRNGATSAIQWTPGTTFTQLPSGSSPTSCPANTTCYFNCTSGVNAYIDP